MTFMYIRNFLTETIDAIEEAGQSILGVDWVGTSDGKKVCSWNDFVTMADFDYDYSYGGQVIEATLVVRFKDSTWLERREYDGSEWWEYKKAPRKARKPEPLPRLKAKRFCDDD